jgi:hypothetical protein
MLLKQKIVYSETFFFENATEFSENYAFLIFFCLVSYKLIVRHCKFGLLLLLYKQVNSNIKGITPFEMEKLTPYSATINVMFFNQDGKGKIF